MNRLKQSMSILRHWLRTYQIHIIAWSVFIFWETVVVIYWVGMAGTFGNYAIHYTINITFFYTYTLLLEKATAFPNGAVWKVPLVVISTILIYLGTVTVVDILLNTYTNILPGELPSLRIRIAKVLYRGSFFLIFSTGYYFLKRFIKEKTEKSRIEKQRFQMLLEKEKTEKELAMSKNAFMKAQINPHLLFNTFEFVHQKLSTYSPEDAKVMLYLSDMMRFAASTQHNEGFVHLTEEISQCENLIGLHQITQGAVYIEIASSPDLDEIKLIPLVLLTILENMFKHGNLNDVENKASIAVYTFDGKLHIESRNLPRLVKSKVGFGSGMDNIRNRLNYAYHQHAAMTAGIDEEGFYYVNISISLAELSMAPKLMKAEQAILV
ncbi:sensor histidine kinase [Pedobacter suwonensis]|uniref:sensor histidine kinase n=2 Tax=Pedobacter suwonensis TaxID=332999 RepID=UPI0025EFC5BE|nr:histidine kinase [uncultured Pedobacter sp.]